MNLNKINLLHFVIDTNDTKATYYFTIIINISTCGNPFVVINLGHHGIKRYPMICHVGEKHIEQRENAHATEGHLYVFLKGNKILTNSL